MLKFSTILTFTLFSLCVWTINVLAQEIFILSDDVFTLVNPRPPIFRGRPQSQAQLAQRISRTDIEQALEQSMARVNRMAQRELRGVIYRRNLRNQPVENTKVRMGFVATMAADNLKKIMLRDGEHINKYQMANLLNSLDLNFTVMESECPYHYDRFRSSRICRHNNIYREIDGFCNNLRNPFQGTTHYPAQRFIPADYGDGLNEPRQSVLGGELPNPRIISTAVLPSETKDHATVTNMVMVFGQLMDHEFAFASSPTTFMFGKIKCCEPENANHPLCMNVHFPRDDHFFSQFQHTCMEMVRSLPVIDKDCRLGPRNQNNEVTSYIDGSPIYGSTQELADLLRSFSGGELKTQPNPFNPDHKPLMPISNVSSSSQCEIRRGPMKCFAAGDSRANENSLLIVIHTIFVREHNRVAQSLRRLNPRWNDEKLYQEARRIVAAEIQHISYNELLPILIGQRNLAKFGLGLRSTGYFIGYDQTVDATVDHGFVTAAFRFGHSLINKEMFRMSDRNVVMDPLNLREDFFQPQHIYRDLLPEGTDPLLRGMFHQHSQNMDNHIVDDVRDHLFKLPHERFGMDLMALNLMRAREQGVPSYNDWREYCGLRRFRNWDDMRGQIIPNAIDGFRAVYNHVDDVDLFVGGVSEIVDRRARFSSRIQNEHSDGILGPTFSCIIGNQFKNFRFGDRFWYENDNEPGIITHAFTPSQLQEIRKVTLARIVCDNSDTITTITRNVFLEPSFENPFVRCEDIPSIDFRFWRS